MDNKPLKTSDAILKWLQRELNRVQKPGRYYGGEYNQIIKPWQSVKVHVALAFPDLYEIGLPNLGLTILYNEINSRNDALAERTYSPWLDMEDLIRENDIPLYSLESKTPIADFDILGITLPYETLYTNALNILDLSRLPVCGSDRKETLPLVIAGGHAVSNPEPMAEFIDAFVIGEGEEVIHDILDLFVRWRATGKSKMHLLKGLAGLEGLYVPSFYTPTYTAVGTIEGLKVLDQDAPDLIHRRLVHPLPPPPTKFIVPSIGIVHDRIPVEIMRGCTRGCRFCHAGMITRPVRERPVAEIIKAIDESLRSTGYNEISLLSLSSSDHSQIQQLVDRLEEKYSGKNLIISLPSLRIESLSVELIKSLQKAHHTTFTLAPESASEKIRNSSNKPISSEDLLKVVREIFENGWLAIKLYFMIGLPGETVEDVQDIVSLSRKVLSIGREIHGNKAAVHLSVNTFVSKPHTPFQWAAMQSLAQIEEKQLLLQNGLRGHGFKLNWSDKRQFQLETWLSRGDRRLSKVIYEAWKNGSKFDAWQDQLKFDTWLDAFKSEKLDPAFYSQRERSLDEKLPWDHISMGVSKHFLRKEYELSKKGKVSQDCRAKCNGCGIGEVFFTPISRQYQGTDRCPPLSVE